MANSSTVSSGDLATAAQYNNLRADTLDTSSGHLHDGTNARVHASLTVKGDEGDPAVILLFADEGDDAGDEWKLNVADGGVLTFGNDIASAGTYVSFITVTPHATTASSSVAFVGDVTVGDDLSLTSDSSVFNMGAGNDFTITHDGTTGATIAGNPLTLDSGGDITLDADGGDIFFKDGGTTFGSATNTSGNLIIKSGTTTAATFSGANVTLAGTVGSGAITSTGIVTGTGFTAGSAVLAESELELLDGLTAGTAIASKVVTTDANIDTSGQRNLTITGELDAATLDISGNADIDGTANLDAVDIDGAVQIDATFTSGVDGQGYDTKFFGDTSGAYILWDTSADKLLTAGGAVVDIVKDKLLIGGTAVTTTAAELNVLDAVTAGTVTASLGVVVDSNKDIGTFRNITLSGELDAATLDLSSSADIAGDLVLSGGADGALQFTNAGENSIKIPDNQASALIIEEADNAYITFVTTNSSEAITVAKATTFSAGIADAGTIAAGTWNGTDVGVAYGGTGASTLTDGGVLLGSGTGAITAMAVLADSEMIVGDGTTDPVAESGATLRTSIGVGTGNDVEFAAITGTTIDATTDFTIGTTVITDDSIVMTPSTSDTVTIAGATNGALSITTVDNAAAAANIQITADGTVDIDSAGVLTLDSGAAINIEPASGSAILLDGTISIDGGVVTGATNVTLSGELDAATLDLSGAADIAGDLVVGSTLLFVDISDSQVGIGVADADTKLHVMVSDASASAASSEVIATFERNGHGYLQMLNTTSTEGGILFGDPDDADIGSMVYKNAVNTFNFRTNATSNQFIIGNDGSATLAGTLTESSDSRIKTNVQTLTSALSKVAQMRGVSFTRTDTGNAGIGLLAQELEAITPELVITGSEPRTIYPGTSDEAVVANVKSISYTHLVAYLVEAIKELKTTVDAL